MTFIGVKYVPGSHTIAIKLVSNTYTIYILYLYLGLQVEKSTEVNAQYRMGW